MKLHGIVTFVLSALIVSICTGGAVYLAVKTGQEPPFTAEYQGSILLLDLVGEEWILDLTLPERAAQALQYGWFLLPSYLRLMLQGITFLFQNI